MEFLTLTSFSYLAIVDASIALLFLLVAVIAVYIIGYYDVRHPND